MSRTWIRPDVLGAFWATMAGDEQRAREHLGNLPPPDLVTFHQDLQALLAWIEEARDVPAREDPRGLPAVTPMEEGGPRDPVAAEIEQEERRTDLQLRGKCGLPNGRQDFLCTRPAGHPPPHSWE